MSSPKIRQKRTREQLLNPGRELAKERTLRKIEGSSRKNASAKKRKGGEGQSY